MRRQTCGKRARPHTAPPTPLRAPTPERMFIGLTTLDHKLKASREGSTERIYGATTLEAFDQCAETNRRRQWTGDGERNVGKKVGFMKAEGNETTFTYPGLALSNTPPSEVRHLHSPMSSEFGTYKPVKAKSWPWLSVEILTIFQVVPSSFGSGGPRSIPLPPPPTCNRRG